MECPLAQPGRAGIDHRARQHRHRTQSVVRQRGAVGTATIGKNDVVAIKRRRMVALVDERPALQLQIDGVVVRGRLVDVALGADDLVAGGLAHCEAQRPRAAHAHAGREALARRFRRNAEDRVANGFAPERKAFAFGYRVR